MNPESPEPGSETVQLPPAIAGDATLTFSGRVRPDLGEAVLPEIDGFDIQRELGRGGMGVVYLARQTKLNREVALKMVISGGQASASDRARFLAEAEMAAALRHPGIVQIHEFGTFNGLPYFALEYCPNGSLAAKLNGSPLTANESAELLVKLAQAIQIAHDNGIVHRDLKPANILLGHDGTPKITDFGLARRGESSHGLTATGAVLGTPSYMAPEQAEGQSNLIGPATDVYALGSILYECLTGRPPFRAATPVDTVLQVIREEPVPPSQLLPKLPRDLETICLKCLRKDPAKRYASATLLADDLQRFLNGEPISARPVGRIERFWKLTKRHPAIAGSTLAGAVALMAVIAIIGVKNRQLGKERDLARTAEQEAVAEQRKNQHLVDLAIEQQERLIARITNVDWSGNRALVAEREKILLDVAEFYRQLLREEADDPVVQQKNADARIRLGMLQIHRGDYVAARESVRQAKQSLDTIPEQLLAEQPETLATRARIEQMTGHLSMFEGEMAEGVEHYRKAVSLSEQLVAIRPDRDDDKMLLTECYFSIVQYYQQTDPTKAGVYSEKIIALGESLRNQAKPTYQARLIYVLGIFQRAQGWMVRGNIIDAALQFELAAAVMDELAKEEPPTARVRELFEQSAAGLAVSRGILKSRLDKSKSGREKAAASLRDGIARFDRVLTANPKSFPFRVAKVNAQLQYAVLIEILGDTQGALKVHQELDESIREILIDHPKMTWLNDLVGASRSVILISLVKEKRFAEIDTKAQEILSWKGRQVTTAKYNVACAFSLASATAPEADRERFAREAVAVLTQIHRDGYFKLPARVVEFQKDDDFNPIRKRPDFLEIEAKIVGK